MSNLANIRERVRSKLLGDNGYGLGVFEDKEAPEVQLQMKQTLESIVTRGMTEEDATLITGISRHIEQKTFRSIARRRGKSWRIVSTLADRLNEFEGVAQIYLAGAANAENLDAALAVKTVLMSRRLDEISAALAQDSPETQSLIERGLQGSREFLLRVWEDAREGYWAEFLSRTRRRNRR